MAARLPRNRPARPAGAPRPGAAEPASLQGLSEACPASPAPSKNRDPESTLHVWGGAATDGSSKVPEDPLHAHHRRALEASSIPADVIAERGYRTITTKADLRRLGFAETQLLVPALLIPIHGVTGDEVLRQVRPDTPRMVRGHILKYETPKGASLRLDVPKRVRALLGDPNVPAYVTEGSKKADSGAARGLCCVALIGVWGWRGTNERGGKIALPDLDCVAWNDRVTHLVFDSDIMTKRPVYEALRRIADVLRLRGAKIRFVYLPSGPGGTKVGLDDFFASGKGIPDLDRLVSTELIRPVLELEERAGPYEATEKGLLFHGFPPGSIDPLPISTFTALIVEEIVRRDGVEDQLLFRIEGRVGGATHTFVLDAEEFGAMNWPMARLGTGAIVNPVRGSERHVRAAIQSLSAATVVRRVEYAHTGWREESDIHSYLHVGGAIGAEGEVQGTRVVLGGTLAHFRLPAPPTGEALVTAVRTSLSFIDIAPARLTIPLYAALWRALVRACDLLINLVGGTGIYKSELAALIQQHTGAGFDARNLPASFTSTANHLAELAFVLKDAPFVIDDFVPTGGAGDMARQHAKVEMIGRQQGNGAGRGRCAPDGSLLAGHASRSLPFLTGEELPRGHSLRARSVILKGKPGDVNLERLGAAQEAARAGVLAGATSGFLRWLASRRATVLAAWRSTVAELRRTFVRPGCHPRTPSNLAELKAGLDLFLSFAHACGAVTETESAALTARGTAGLVEAGVAQDEALGTADPVDRFRGLLTSLLSAGRGHLTDLGGGAPGGVESLVGWQPAGSLESEEDGPATHWRACGDRVGWMQDGALYLDGKAAHRAAQLFAQAGGESLPLDEATLGERLDERGLLVGHDPGRTTRKVSLGGGRPRVWHLRTDFLLFCEDAGHAGQGDASTATETTSAAPQAGADAGQAAGQQTPAVRVPGWSGRFAPPGACPNCRGTEFLAASDGRPICTRCHPPVGPRGGT